MSCLAVVALAASARAADPLDFYSLVQRERNQSILVRRESRLLFYSMEMMKTMMMADRRPQRRRLSTDITGTHNIDKTTSQQTETVCYLKFITKQQLFELNEKRDGDGTLK